MRTLTRLLVSAAATASLATPVAAQLRYVGIQAGRIEARQVRDRAPTSDKRTGILVGVYADPHTPLPWLSALVELSYAQRGGRYALALPGGMGLTSEAQVRSEYLSFVVAPTTRLSLGPVSLLAYAGPSMDALIRTRATAAIQQAYRLPTEQGLAVVAGGGIEVRIPGGRAVRTEIRKNWGLSTAYSGDTDDYRNRSTEILVRVGRHPPS